MGPVQLSVTGTDVDNKPLGVNHIVYTTPVPSEITSTTHKKVVIFSQRNTFWPFSPL